MANHKHGGTKTVNRTITLPVKLARLLDAEVAKARRQEPLAIISRSALYCHALSEWLAILNNPHREPTLPMHKPAARVRVRPGARRQDSGGALGDARDAR